MQTINATNDFNYLWNELPKAERIRLMPHMIEQQVLHMLQCKAKAVRAHNLYIGEIDDQVLNLQKLLHKENIPGDHDGK